MAWPPLWSYKGNYIMIQDIGEGRLDISHGLQKPSDGDRLFIDGYKDKTVYVKMLRDDIPDIPFFPLKDDSLRNKEFKFLFRIAGTAYFTIIEDGTELFPYEHNTYSFQKLSVFRKSAQTDLRFAASTGWQLYKWYMDNRFCGRCGGKMKYGEKERSVICKDCGLTVYPKIMPAVIIGVTNGDDILMTRYRGREYKGHALIAGFCEIGESAEDTVRREVMEEAGIRVKNIRYYKSQPWGFDQDLLLGFYCEADGDCSIKMDDGELSEAVWVNRKDITEKNENMSLTNEMIVRFKEG